MTFGPRFGRNIRRLRRARNLTQEMLAERSQLSVDAVRRIESAGFSPSLESIQRLCQGLEISLRTLFQSFDADLRSEVSEISDFLANRSDADLRIAKRVLRALFDEDG